MHKIIPILNFRYAKKLNQNPDAQLRPRYDSRLIFTREQEGALEEYLILSSKMFYGLTSKDCRELAYEMAIKNNISVPNSWKINKTAGEEWYKYFRVRHPRLSCRKPEACSLSRATSFNKHNVAAFFTKLEEVLKRNEHFRDGTRLYNLDETGTTTVQSTKKVLCQKGLKQINQCTSSERGILVTTCCIICAAGFALPPVMVFPRVKFKPHMTKDAPPGTLGLATQSGWMNKELFVQVMKHFINLTHSSIENPTCLLMDNHESHLSIETLNLAKKYGVTILTLPPHCSHRLQPLDVSIFGPFKAHYNSAIQAWLLNHPGVPLSLYDIGFCVAIAHERSMTPANITSGFRKTGIFPFDPNIFSEEDFLCSAVTDRPKNMSLSEKLNENIFAPDQDPSTSSTSIISTTTNLNPNITDMDQGSSRTQTSNFCKGEYNFVSPKEFKGFPKAENRKKGNSRQKGKSMIATDTPEKEELEKREIDRNKRNVKVVRKRVLDSSDPKNERINICSRKPTPKRVIPESSDTSDDDLSVTDGLNTSSGDENWVPEPRPSGFEELARIPVKDDYVLVEFKESTKKLPVYYVARILEVQSNGDFFVTYLRKSTKMRDKFIFPVLQENSIVQLSDIKLLLPEPKAFGSTTRQQSHLSFEINFGFMDVR